MKKVLVLLLAVLICLPMSACGKSEPDAPASITVVVDLMNADDIQTMENYAELRYPNIKVDLITLDYNEDDMSKRNGQIASIRADIMAGKGPDAFILSTVSPSRQISNNGTVVEYDKLFGDPEKIMCNQVLLPLDDYMANSQVFSAEDHVTAIMDAGKYDGKQYILPLTYTYDLLLYDPSLIGNSEFETWDDVLGFENKGLGNSLKSRSFTWIGSRFADISDYESNTLSFTEDELRKEIETINSMGDKAAYDFTPLNMTTDLSTMALDEWTTWGDAAVPVPVLNNENGITAYVDHYAAINANSENPDAAYKFIELFFSPEVQRMESLPYQDGGETVYRDYELRPDGMLYLTGCGIATGKALYEEYPMLEDMNAKINHVRFYTPIDKLLHDLVYEYQSTSDDRLISSYYSQMQMEIAE